MNNKKKNFLRIVDIRERKMFHKQLFFPFSTTRGRKVIYKKRKFFEIKFLLCFFFCWLSSSFLFLSCFFLLGLFVAISRTFFIIYFAACDMENKQTFDLIKRMKKKFFFMCSIHNEKDENFSDSGKKKSLLIYGYGCRVHESACSVNRFFSVL